MTAIGQHLATIDRLRARDFPARPVVSGSVTSGPGFHLADLRVSRDFWDADLVEWEAVAEEFEDELTALVQALAERWGPPHTLDLAEHLERAVRGEPVPEPLATLCGYVPRVHGWRVEGRWVGLGVGQGDRELPFQLVAAVADEDVGPLADPGRP